MIEASQENMAVDQLISRLKEYVPQLVIEGPFYYQNDPVTYPYHKSYKATHPLDAAMTLYIHNGTETVPYGSGTPRREEYNINNINVSINGVDYILALGSLSLGSTYTQIKTCHSAKIFYVTLISGEDYLLWQLSTEASSTAAELRWVYAPLYNEEHEVYGLMYPGLYAYSEYADGMCYYLTYKDTILTDGQMNPKSGEYGIRINFYNRYRYPEFDVTLPTKRENCQAILTKNTALYIETMYGTHSVPTNQSQRLLTIDLLTRICILAIPDCTKNKYPVGGILRLDGQDYYIVKLLLTSTQYDYCAYYLFEL